MVIRIIFLLIVTGTNFLVVNGQNKSQVSPLSELTIGQQLPDIRIENLINSKKLSVSTADYKGKLLILDFWATWCTPCVAYMPQMDSLQRAFGSQIQILPVTYQSKEVVEKYVRNLPVFKNFSLPMATEDKILRRLFRHKYLPHYVWINETGKVIAITGKDEVTAANIQQILAGTATPFKVKKDKIVTYDRQKPVLFQDLGISETDIRYQSLLTGYKEGLSTRMDVIRDKEQNIRKISMLNSSFTSMARLAWSDTSRYFERTMMALEVADTGTLIGNVKGDELREWRSKHAWCYELIVSPELSPHVFDMMRADMTRLFPQFSVTIEKRTTKCLVLERTSDKEKFKSAGGKVKFSFDALGGKMQHCRMGLLTSQLNFTLQLLEIPIINATGYAGPVDMTLEGNLANVESIRKALKPYDLDLVEKDYEIDMVVIRDRE